MPPCLPPLIHLPPALWRLMKIGPAEFSRKDMPPDMFARSEEHTSELQSLMRISYAVFCLKKKKITILDNTLNYNLFTYHINIHTHNKLSNIKHINKHDKMYSPT